MATLSARLGALTNATHGFIYFAEAATSGYEALGLAGRQQYFASRAAAMGSVGPELIVATFFNFCPDRVTAAVPACWQVASPADVLAARMNAASQVLTAACPDLPAEAVVEATTLAQSMVDGVGDEGKPLAAANRTVQVPDDPWIALWQLLTVIREWRGDAHVAVLGSHAVTAVEALVLHAATGKVPRSALEATRGWPAAAWDQAVDSLAVAGHVDDAGEFTETGRAFREQIENDTNLAAQPLVDAIGDDQAGRFCELLTPIRDGLIAAGAFARLQSVR